MTTNTCPTALSVADETSWFKSSYSTQDNGGGCVSIAVLTRHVGIRDSKQSDGPAFVVSTPAWGAFIRQVQRGGIGRSDG
ncbi:DUF397 domain-containing protein [Streptomyces sp. NPDC001678]|uniref:DUF397 domain-containing protein n=1 Tax=Streptomyces sp. NPDC001678 TaxID=3364599 RepID=UPI0036795B56